MNCLTEYDEEATHRAFRREGYEDGLEDGMLAGLAKGERKKALEDAVTLINKYNVTPEVASADMGVSLEDVLQYLKLYNLKP